MTALEAIKQAYDITDHMTVSGGAIEQVAALRAYLREANKALTVEQPDNTEG